MQRDVQVEAQVEVQVEQPVEAPKEEEKSSEDEMLKKVYMEELENSGIKDQNLLNNLKYMMNMGYLNYKINYNLLKRNDNDLIIAINKLCNNIVTDTMFEIKK